MDKKLEHEITLGIFGGSFDPPHKGHVKLCREFSKLISSKILVMPAKISPFKMQKQICISDDHRMKMCRLAFSDIDGVEICDYELKKDEVSYTYKTVEHLLNVNPNEKICICIGADCLETLECWANAKYLFEKCVFAAAYRYEDAERSFGEAMEKLRIKYDAKIIPLLYSPFEVSSTDVRRAIFERKNTDKLLSEEVALYIEQNNLYRGEQK